MKWKQENRNVVELKYVSREDDNRIVYTARRCGSRFEPLFNCSTLHLVWHVSEGTSQLV
jgi:hypothetical protein